MSIFRTSNARKKEIGRKTEKDIPTLVLPDMYCFIRTKKGVVNNSIKGLN